MNYYIRTQQALAAHAADSAARIAAMNGLSRNEPAPMRIVRRRRLFGLGDEIFPTGSTFVYNATFHGQPSSDVENAVAQQLPSRGIVVDSYSTVSFWTPGQGFTLNAHTTKDFGAAADVKSIIDGLIYQYVNPNPLTAGAAMPQSTLVPTGAPAVTTPTAPGTATDTPSSPMPPASSGSPIDEIGNVIASVFGPSSPAGVTLPPTGAGGEPQSWLRRNWPWLALGTGGFLLLREIL